jgi:energy-coupling factor transport system ATP-binding protein
MGKARANGKVGYMPQYARDYFLRERVRDEIVDWDSPQMKALAGKLSISHLCEANPFDLSGGEQQKCVLAAILSRKPDILLLDEPTKGIDPSAKKALGTLLNEFTASGGTVITATHDFEFAAEYASRCAMLFDGEIVCEDTPRGFFADNRFYTTAIHKGLRHIDARAVFQDDVSILWAR